MLRGVRPVAERLIFLLVGLLVWNGWFQARAAEGGGWPEMGAPKAQGGGSSDAAVVVGIEDYAFVDDVPGARKNAEDWYRWLTIGRGVPPGRVSLLVDGQATDVEIRAAVRRAASQVLDGGMVWFIFVGHGATSSDGRDGLLVGMDAQRTAVGIEARSVRRSEVVTALSSRGSVRPVLVLDTCFSGRDRSGHALVEGLQWVVPGYALEAGQATVFSAAASDQYAGPLPGTARPAFSYLLLGALRGWADADLDGRITAEEAQTYTEGALHAVVTGRRQDPQLQGPDVAMVLSRGKEKGPDLSRLALEFAGRIPESTPTPEPEATRDLDRDGYIVDAPDAPDMDCNDGDPSVHPGAAEIPGNDIDDDCFGGDEPIIDGDRDGFAANDPDKRSRDCDDADPSLHRRCEAARTAAAQEARGVRHGVDLRFTTAVRSYLDSPDVEVGAGYHRTRSLGLWQWGGRTVLGYTRVRFISSDGTWTGSGTDLSVSGSAFLTRTWPIGDSLQLRSGLELAFLAWLVGLPDGEWKEMGDSLALGYEPTLALGMMVSRNVDVDLLLSCGQFMMIGQDQGKLDYLPFCQESFAVAGTTERKSSPTWLATGVRVGVSW